MRSFLIGISWCKLYLSSWNLLVLRRNHFRWLIALLILWPSFSRNSFSLSTLHLWLRNLISGTIYLTIWTQGSFSCLHPIIRCLFGKTISDLLLRCCAWSYAIINLIWSGIELLFNFGRFVISSIMMDWTHHITNVSAVVKLMEIRTNRVVVILNMLIYLRPLILSGHRGLGRFGLNLRSHTRRYFDRACTVQNQLLCTWSTGLFADRVFTNPETLLLFGRWNLICYWIKCYLEWWRYVWLTYVRLKCRWLRLVVLLLL